MKAGVLPVDNKLTIYRGAAGSFLLTFTDENDDPIDLTGKTFSAQVRNRSGGPLLMTITVEETDLENGQVTLVWNTADTDQLRPSRAMWGLSDSDGIYWIHDTCIIEGKIPE